MKIPLKQKALRTGLKYHYGTYYYCEKYSCTIEDVLKRVDQLYYMSPEEAEKIKKELLENDEKFRAAQIAKMVAESQTEETSASVPEEVVEEVADTYEAILAQEQRLSTEVMNSEANWQSLRSEHRENINKVRTIKRELKDIEKRILELQKRFKTETEADAEVIEQMNQVFSTLSRQKADLTEARMRREEFEQIMALVDGDGNIEFETKVEFEPCYDGHAEMFGTLIGDDRCAAFTVIELRTLAKVICAAQNLQPRSLEVMFDNEKLADIFRLYTTAV